MHSPFLIAASADLPVGWIIAGAFVLLVILVAIVQAAQAAAAKATAQRVRSRSDFHASDVYVSPLDQNGLSIDATSSRLLLVSRSSERVVDASQLISVEIIADDSTLVRTNRGSQVAGAAVGGLLLGPVGLLLGGLSGSTRSEGRIRRLVLRVVTADFQSPNHDVLLYKSSSDKGDKRSSILLREPIRLAETWHSRVTASIRKLPSDSSHPAASSDIGSVADEIRKLDGLRREGLLTSEEFGQQKQRLLNQASSNPSSS